MKLAKIIDKGECYSTSNLVVNGVPANKFEWFKYNFYPKNDMVGELLNVNGNIVIKISEDIYVHMSSRGVKEISKPEYIAGQKNNVFTGVDEKQQKINEGIDAYSMLLGQMFEGSGRNNANSQLEQDADIYYVSFKVSAAKQGERIQYRINAMASEISRTSLIRLPYYQAIDTIISLVKESIIDEGWRLDEVDGVSWFLGLYSAAYVRALGTLCLKTDKDVFKTAFIKYFNEL